MIDVAPLIDEFGDLMQGVGIGITKIVGVELATGTRADVPVDLPVDSLAFRPNEGNLQLTELDLESITGGLTTLS